MTTLVDPSAPKFGLPRSLQIPIAARGLDAIGDHVGTIVERRLGRDGQPKALLVASDHRSAAKEPDVPLWRGPLAAVAEQRLLPEIEVWVHVDYGAYRAAYRGFGLEIPSGYYLDHVQNRRAIRKRGRVHPWLRLCPVDATVNTSGGSQAGGEGMENEFLDGHEAPETVGVAYQVIYADPMDLTKMLNVAPGTVNLPGVRDTQGLFYPSR